MADIKVKFGALTSGALRGFKKIGRGIGGIFKSMSSLKGLIAGGLIAKGFIGIVSAGAKLEQTKIAFEVMLKSAEKAKQVLSDLRGFADVTPFRTSEIIQAGRGLMAVVSNYKELVPIIRKLGDISAGTGKDLNELVAIYNKVGLTGKMQARELRQLSIANIPIVQLLGEKYKRNGRQIFKMGEQGRLTFKDLKWAIDALTNSGGKFGGLMAKQAQTLAGKWSTFQGVVENTMADLGGGAKPLARVVDAMTRGVRALREWKGLLESIASTAESIANIAEAIPEWGGTSGPGGFETNVGDTIADALSSNAATYDVPFLGKTNFNPFASVSADVPMLGQTELNPGAIVPALMRVMGFGSQAKMDALNTPESRAEMARARFDVSGQASAQLKPLLEELVQMERQKQNNLSGY